MAGSRTLKLSILGDVDNLNKSLKSATKDVETFGDKMTNAGKVAGAALAAASAAAGAFAIKIGIEAVKAASNLSETVSKVGVLFGKTSKDIENFAKTAASSLGQRAIGVVSTSPAYMMNSELIGGTYIALKGRVPVKVFGSVNKGDQLVAGNDGTAIVGNNNVFAVALETNTDSDVKLVECVIL
jgi:hypothetical protein